MQTNLMAPRRHFYEDYECAITLGRDRAPLYEGTLSSIPSEWLTYIPTKIKLESEENGKFVRIIFII